MVPPLQIIQDNQGRLRDVNGQPMIMVFDSKPKPNRKSRTSTLAKEKAARRSKPKSFTFINSSKPKIEDEDTRKLIRTHVMQNHFSRAEQTSTEDTEIEARSFTLNSSRVSSVIAIPPQKATSPTLLPPIPNSHSFIIFPVTMQPYMYNLIYQFSTAIVHLISPQHPQPLIPEASPWYPMIMTDPALFHIILCTSSIYLHLLSNRQQNFLPPQQKHMGEAISIINSRLRDINVKEEGYISDTTISTILFMAKAEHIQGNYKTYNIHMSGLNLIITHRGGINQIPLLIQEKFDEVSGLGEISH